MYARTEGRRPLIRKAARQLGPGPGDATDYQLYCRRNHKLHPPQDYIFKINAKTMDTELGPHLIDEVDLLARLYPEHRTELLNSVVWYETKTPARGRKKATTALWTEVRAKWKEPSAAALVPDHTTVPLADGTFDIYIIAMLPNMDNLSMGGVRRSLLRGVPISDYYSD